MNNVSPEYVVTLLILVGIPALVYIRYKYKNKKSKKSDGFDSSDGFGDGGFGNH